GIRDFHVTGVQTCALPIFFDVAVEQFNIAADVINLSENMRGILSHCNRETIVNFPVEMDDGSVQMFTGYRVHHNSGPGPTKGGRSEERRVGKARRSRGWQW